MKTRLLTATALISLLAVLGTGSVDAKASAKKATASRRSHEFFVPPPPAYMPSVLPVMNTKAQAEVADVPMTQTVQTLYSKYIYVRDGYGTQPQPLQSNKGVTNWAKPSDQT